MEKSDRMIMNREADYVFAVQPLIRILNQRSKGFNYFPKFGLVFLGFYLFKKREYFEDFRSRRYH